MPGLFVQQCLVRGMYINLIPMDTKKVYAERFNGSASLDSTALLLIDRLVHEYERLKKLQYSQAPFTTALTNVSKATLWKQWKSPHLHCLDCCPGCSPRT